MLSVPSPDCVSAITKMITSGTIRIDTNAE